METDHMCDELRAIVERSLKGEDVFHEMFGHRSKVCFGCIRRRITAKRAGREWLWHDRPPPWIEQQKREQEANTDQTPSTSRELKGRPELVGRGIPDGLTAEEYIEKLLRERKEKGYKMGYIQVEAMKLLQIKKGEAVVKVRELLRKINQQTFGDKTEKPKVAKREEMAWCPHITNLFLPDRTSKMDMLTQKKYVAVLSNINQIGSSKFEDNMLELKGLDQMHSLEREEYDLEARNYVNGATFKWLPPGAINFVMKRWRQRFHNLNAEPNFMTQFSSRPLIEIPFDSAKRDLWNETMCPFVEKIAASSSTKRTFVQPSIKTLSSSRLSQDILNRRFCVQSTYSLVKESELEFALCSSTKTSIVMEASAILALCANDWMGCYSDYAIPVKVMSKYGAEGMQTIRIVGRPLPTGVVAQTAVVRHFYKWMVKAKVAHDPKDSSVKASTRRFLFKKQAQTTETKEITSPAAKRIALEDLEEGEVEDQPRNYLTISNTPAKNQYASHDGQASIVSEIDASAPEGKLVIEEPNDSVDNEMDEDYLSDLNRANPKNSPKKESVSPNKTSGILDFLLDEATKSSGTDEGSTLTKKTEAQYTKICFGADSMPILVRSRGGLTDVDGSTVTFDTKIEYVPECGAMALSDEEWLYHYMKALLSGTRKHILFRIHPTEAIILQMEIMNFASKCSAQQQYTDSRGSLLTTRSLRIRNIIDEIHSLTPGDFLLVKKGQTLQILPSSPEDSDGGNLVTLSGIRSKLHWRNEMPNIDDVYHGIEHRRVLQWQVVMGRAPATFLPADHPTAKYLREHKRRKPTQDDKTTSGIRGNSTRNFQRIHPNKNKGPGKRGKGRPRN